MMESGSSCTSWKMLQSNALSDAFISHQNGTTNKLRSNRPDVLMMLMNSGPLKCLIPSGL